jgi:hypothetical protein
MLIDPFMVIQYTGFDDIGSGKVVAISVKSGTTISTEVRGDLLAGICGFGDLLW